MVSRGGGQRIVQVGALSASARRGHVRLGQASIPCALGRSGSRALKREGDGATPRGHWPVRSVYYRADRVARPACGLPVRAVRPSDGWCDAPGDRNYNRRVCHPYPASAERMWRDDHLYDLVLVLGHNDRPRRQGLGSAIFMHLARDGFHPTEGCIAVCARDMRRVLAALRPRTVLAIGVRVGRKCRPCRGVAGSASA